ncbi:hypothetical protein IE53DRAFT_210787 [Violaceomyces palustris]|uniref:Uncharacterized protein n=1 Tax=Violaceomyces palustris TaxID=1673888 RepID=A0ACD0NQX1_9BASI|nr:hypothetical protein IE53DRAFT_210787 [Violaceomyces palustris]
MTADRNPTSPSSSKAATKEKAKTAEVEERQVVETLKRKMDPRAMILPSGLSLNQYRSKMKEEEVLESDEEEMVEDRTPSPPRKAPRSKEEGGFHAKGRGRDRPDDGKVGERSQRARVGVGVGSTMMSLSENPKLEMDLRKSQRVSLEYLESLEAKRRRLWEYEQGRRRRDWRDPRPSPRPMASGQNRSMSSNQVGSLFPLPDQGISIRTGLEESRGGREEHTLPPRTRTNLTPSSLTREWERSRGYPNP